MRNARLTTRFSLQYVTRVLSVKTSGSLLFVQLNQLSSMSISEIQNPTAHCEDSSVGNTATWKIKLLYDGDCPLCLREVNFLSKRDADRGLVNFVNISDADYNPEDNAGVDYETAMGRIHAILPSGDVITDVEVFRRTYNILGMGWIYAATTWPVIGPFVDWVYARWAERRLALTGRPDLHTLVAARQQCADSDDSQCRL